MSLVALIALPFVGSLCAALLNRSARTTAALLAAVVTLGGATLLAFQYPQVSSGTGIRERVAWLPTQDLDLIIRVDGLSWVFAMLVLLIGALVVLYARYYMSKDDPVPRFYAYLLAFMGAMLGIVTSGNLIQLVFFWELTSIFSFLLIGYWHQNANARDGARMALTVTALGGLSMLGGVLVIGSIVGSFDLDVVLASGAVIKASPLYLPALILVLLGAFTKSAQFPFHFWLPHAMAAPTPVSAYLHSATMVKAGVFLLIRMWPALAGTGEWYVIVSATGLVTLLLGAVFACFQQDLKGLLAYSTISHLGLITLLLGFSTPLGLVAAVFHALNHATFKASLFMAAGIIDHETGTRDLRRLSGLFKFMPITGTLAIVAAAAMAGVPLLNGFLSKEMFLAEALESHTGSPIDMALPYLATLASLFSVLYSVRFIHQVFFGPKATELPREPHEPPSWMRFPVELLVLVCLVVGVVPAVTIGPFLNSAVVSVLGGAAPAYSLRVWHGFNTPLMLSFIALAGGLLAYLVGRPYLERNAGDGPPWGGRLRARMVFDGVMAAIFAGAQWLYDLMGTRRLQPQLRLLVLVALGVATLPFIRLGFSFGDVPGTPADPVFVLIWVVAGACAIGSAILAKYHRLAALILMGGTGIITCVTFMMLSAPDLALTQLVVEITTTVLLLLGLRWLPKRQPLPETGMTLVKARARRTADLLTAVATGGGVAALVYAVMTRPLPDTISKFFVDSAYLLAGGRNVVNVIIVDFRAFDTLGEITVLGTVALTIFALLRRFRPAKDSIGATAQQRRQALDDREDENREEGDTAEGYLLIPRVFMHWLFPVVASFAVFLFLRGHDLPGGGFAGGVTMAIGFILQYMAGGTRWVEARLRILPVRWIGFGLLTAGLTGAGAWLFGYPFLTSHHEYLELPVLGRLPFATATLFDIGVFVLVVGATVLMLIAIGHQSIRSARQAATAEAAAEIDEAAGN